MTIYPSSDPVGKGYIYANQRADDIAKDRTRLTKIEANAKANETVYTANGLGSHIVNGTLGVTGAVAVPKVSYGRTIRLEWVALCTGLSASNTVADLYVRSSGDRVSGTTTRFTDDVRGTASGTRSLYLPANTAGSYQVVCSVTNGAADFTDNPDFTQLRAVATTIS
jgi:hypothetical protein